MIDDNDTDKTASSAPSTPPTPGFRETLSLLGTAARDFVREARQVASEFADAATESATVLAEEIRTAHAAAEEALAKERADRERAENVRRAEEAMRHADPPPASPRPGDIFRFPDPGDLDFGDLFSPGFPFGTGSPTRPVPPVSPTPPTSPTPPSPPQYVRNPARGPRPVRPERQERQERENRQERQQREERESSTSTFRAEDTGNEVREGQTSQTMRTGTDPNTGSLVSEGEMRIGEGTSATLSTVSSAGRFTISAERSAESHTVAFRGDRVLVDGVDVTEFLQTARERAERMEREARQREERQRAVVAAAERDAGTDVENKTDDTNDDHTNDDHTTNVEAPDVD